MGGQCNGKTEQNLLEAGGGKERLDNERGYGKGGTDIVEQKSGVCFCILSGLLLSVFPLLPFFLLHAKAKRSAYIPKTDTSSSFFRRGLLVDSIC